MKRASFVPRSILAAALLLGVAASACDRPAEPAGSTPAASVTDARGSSRTPLDSIEVMTGGATPDQRVPMVVAIHGLGDRPESFKEVLPSLDAPARLVFVRGFSPWHGGHSWFDFRRDDPEGMGERIAAAADRLAAGIQALVASRPTAGRPIVTGFSQGGMLSFALAVRHPKIVAAAFPMGGMLPASLRPASAPEDAPPIFAWHGAADRTVSPDLARATMEDLRKAGFRVELELSAGVGHTIPPATRAWLRERVTAAVRDAARE